MEGPRWVGRREEEGALKGDSFSEDFEKSAKRGEPC